MKYKSVMVTERSGPDRMQIVEQELQPPAQGEVTLKVLAAPVCGPDIQARYGQTPIVPKTPFIPGYAVIGEVHAVGKASSPDQTKVKVGQRFAALTIFGGYAEYISIPIDELIPVPESLDPGEAVTLVLNYIVAYQTLRRSARVKTGESILIIGASGGVGTAYLDLGRMMGLNIYAIASRQKFNILEDFGATPIDYRSQDFVEVLQKAEPGGLDAVFDGMIYGYLDEGFKLLKRGGVWVQYGNPLSFKGLLSLLGRVIWFNLRPDGRKLKIYGTTTSKFGRNNYLQDWEELFKLLEDGKIHPIIHQKFPLLEAARANALLESGEVVGNVVLLSPDLL
ncbi:MAG: zinc-binding dehydrogenase [Anaerolineaceae bacterium]|nr:zinc-binding dehydrogenase [Anaerolineaceae bacterium]